MFRSIRKRKPVEGPFYKQRGWIHSAGFLGFFVVMSLVALSTGATIDSSSSETATAAESRETLSGLSGPLSPGDPQKARGGPEGRPANCRTDDRNTSRPTTTPADLRWRKLTTVMVPTSLSAGPLHTDSSVWWCFAHTPTGAVLAAHVIPLQLSGSAWRAVAEQQLVPGEARDRFVIGKVEAGETDPAENTFGRFAGFSLTSYTADSATVRLLLVNPVGGYLSTSVSVRWRDGDWKVAPQNEGSPYSSTTRQARPDGFAAWGV
ncbi:hypothetical protein P3L51_32690 [Streptomyces sp. PSRA5]|uniref:hypothetical protein n=1 Tax=Streptomyces panacea TaxID=3035064 RepID=UPI00339D231C